jgi:hypothetical protein
MVIDISDFSWQYLAYRCARSGPVRKSSQFKPNRSIEGHGNLCAIATAKFLAWRICNFWDEAAIRRR